MKQSPSPDRHVRLIRTSDGLTMMPPEQSPPGLTSGGFAIPGFPMSQVVFLDTLGRRFWEVNHRCLAVWLMVDSIKHRWVRPEIPTQRCHGDGVAWSYQPADFADRPEQILIGGSYQVAFANTVEEVMASVPPCDGFHVLHLIINDQAMAILYLTTEGQTQIVERSQVFVDDWAAALLAHKDRTILV